MANLEVLKLPVDEKNRPFPFIRKQSTNRRIESVNEAIAFSSGTVANQKIHELYSGKNIKVVMGKPGKEANPNYKGKLGDNINDMTPMLLLNGKRHPNNFGFDDIFEILSDIGKINPTTLELIGCILLRASYMLDHKKDESGNWRLEIPSGILSLINQDMPKLQKIPMEFLIYLLDAIALNEDVKYYTLGKNDKLTAGTGRRNNLLTYCHLIGVLLERTSFTKFVGSFARIPSGVAPLTQKNTFEVFPMLKPISLVD